MPNRESVNGDVTLGIQFDPREQMRELFRTATANDIANLSPEELALAEAEGLLLPATAAPASRQLTQGPQLEPRAPLNWLMKQPPSREALTREVALRQRVPNVPLGVSQPGEGGAIPPQTRTVRGYPRLPTVSGTALQKVDLPPEEERTWGQAAASMGIRVVPQVLGTVAGAALAPVTGGLSIPALSAVGAGVGEYLGQKYDKPDADVNPWAMGASALMATLPALGPARTVMGLGLSRAPQAGVSALADNAVARMMRAGVTNAMSAPVETATMNWSQGRPLMENMGTNTVMGAGLGAGFGGVVEGVRAGAPYVQRTLGDLADTYQGSRLSDQTGAIGPDIRSVRGGVVDGADEVIDDAGEALAQGSAGWFPKPLKNYLDSVAAEMRDQQRATWVAAGKDPKAFGPRISEIQTRIKNIIRNDISRGDPREAQRLIDGYFTTALPSNYKGVNFDARRPIVELMREDPSGGAQFDDTSKARLALAYEQGVQRSEREQWGDSRWLYHLSGGDPTAAVQITRLLGAFSPGQKTDANTLNAIEAFLRTMRGEKADDILGRLIPDPARPGKTMRADATLSTGHPRPNTVQDNLQRAILLGRIFQAKVEALAGAELGLHNDIPIDLWLMRAIGASSDSTPPESAYRLISESMAKEAAAKGENPFTYMAKVWMGMQDIVGTPSPSFSESAARLRLPSHLKTPGVADQVLSNIDYHAAGVKDPSLPGARSVIATDPAMPYGEWEQRAKDIFLKGKDTDVLGKVPIVQNPKKTTLWDFVRQATDSERLDRMQRGGPVQEAVIGNMPLEFAPGAKSGVLPSFSGLSQDDQNKASERAFRALLNPEGKVGVAEALFPGRTAPPIAGEGYWPTPQGVQRNRIMTTPIELRTAPSGRRLDTEDSRRSMALGNLVGILLGQDAVPMTAVQFEDVGLPKNVLRAWPGGGEKMPRDVQGISAALPAGEAWVVQHRDTGADLFKASGKTLQRSEKGALESAAKGVMTPEGLRGAGARSGTNISGKVGYMTPEWGAEGSQQATKRLLKVVDGLSGTDKTALDAAVQPAAKRLLRQLKGDPNTSSSHLTFVKIVAEGGLKALRRALAKDPSLQVPVLLLPALGLGALFAPRQSESPDERS